MNTRAQLAVRVRDISDAADGVKIVEFEAVDGHSLPPAIAGQYIDVTVAPGITRSYSLLDSSAESPKVYRIAVALVKQSRGGSRFVHESLRVGTCVDISSPSGNFTVENDDSHSVFIAGGIGITPVLAMIRQLTTEGRSWELHYAAKSRSRAPFLRELVDDAVTDPTPTALYITEEAGPRTMRVANILQNTPNDTQLYCCGPASLLDEFLAATHARPAENIHVERFQSGIESAAGGFTVELVRSGVTLEVAEDASILDVVLDAGVDVEFSCEEGICGSCRTRVLQGKPDHRDSILSSNERAAGDVMFICCSGSKGDRLVLDL
ncbi:PDR/VanB family oxidoreductase (plasmid) [Rhodococcus sp. USK10]|uniref:PDR/VanB family oxidoreductase n=1 Tax=Rhodococcus sp. USK10 TaxID=2789739 RepID=UPI001C5E453C|nr:PDR/VanB family oxidoreductase [Rhodococcus sp. USK10]QYB00238.1 PDR/VanB family oxidoreductase [Rhodococcus sp. USK10]